MALVPRRNINVVLRDIPNNQNVIQVANVNQLRRTIRVKALQNIAVNLFMALVTIYAAYTFFMSDAYLQILDTTGQVRFIKNFSLLLVNVLDATEYIANTVPQLYNTINAVVPAYTTTLVKNFITDPVQTITKFHKRAGLKPSNMAVIGVTGSLAALLNLEVARGSRVASVLASVGGVSAKGVREFLRSADTLSEKELKRQYLTLTVVGGVGVLRNYIEALTQQILRNTIVSVTTIVGSQFISAGRSMRQVVYPRLPTEAGIQRIE